MTRVLALFACLVAPGAWGQCSPREAVIATLERDKYQEVQRGYGVHRNGFIIELWTGPDGSWTVVRSNPDGTACILAYGRGWVDVKGPAGKRS